MTFSKNPTFLDEKRTTFSRNVMRRILSFDRFNGPVFAAKVCELGGVDEQA